MKIFLFIVMTQFISCAAYVRTLGAKKTYELNLPVSGGLEYTDQQMSSGTQIIFFDERLVPTILDRSKTSTIRYGEVYKLGKAIGKSTDQRTEFPLTITSIENVVLNYGEGGITAEILVRETFEDTSIRGFNRLVSNLQRYYPELKLGDPVSIVIYELDK